MKKVLLIEDDPNLGLMIQDLLELNGYDVKLLRRPDETLHTLQQENFDLLIMDKLLNGIDGTRICAEIRKTKGISTIPILMMSALDGARQVCIEAGATDFIYKPFDIKDLLSIVMDTMKKEKHRDE